MSQFELPKMELLDLGIVFDHNHPCCVCREKHSVLNLKIGVMEPCWDCQEKGFQIIHREQQRVVKMWRKLTSKPNGRKWKS